MNPTIAMMKKKSREEMTLGEAETHDLVAEMLARGTFDPGALAILCDQCRQQRKEPAPPMALDLAQHVVDRDVLQHDLGGYDV